MLDAVRIVLSDRVSCTVDLKPTLCDAGLEGGAPRGDMRARKPSMGAVSGDSGHPGVCCSYSGTFRIRGAVREGWAGNEQPPCHRLRCTLFPRTGPGSLLSCAALLPDRDRDLRCRLTDCLRFPLLYQQLSGRP